MIVRPAVEERGEWKANATLIAAAPRILAALRGVLAACVGEPPNDAAHAAKSAALYEAAAAIKAATIQDDERATAE